MVIIKCGLTIECRDLLESIPIRLGLSACVPSRRLFAGLTHVSFRGKSRRDLLIISIAARDPELIPYGQRSCRVCIVDVPTALYVRRAAE
jgi:hypothetical protein